MSSEGLVKACPEPSRREFPPPRHVPLRRYPVLFPLQRVMERARGEEGG